MKTGVKAVDAMTKQPVVLPGTTTIESCAKTMDDKHVGAVLVVDGDAAAGILTEQDIVRKLVAQGSDLSKATINDVMERNLITIKPDLDIFEALVVMRDENIRHLPVIDSGAFLGLLTMKDVLKLQPQLFDLLVDKFELREADRKHAHIVSENEGVCQTCGNYARKLFEKDDVLVCKTCADL